MQDSKESSTFPAPIYRDTVLAPVFRDAKRYFLAPLLEIEYAHTLMLERQGIMPTADAAACLHAIDTLDVEALRSAEYDGSFEDLFFYLERYFASVAGASAAGRMHTARSRNDIDLTMYRMNLRRLLLEVHGATLALRGRLLDLASRHSSALMPAYTHNQPAQPTTLGHYLMAFVEVLERDAERLGAAFTRVNRNPLGACAITTTGFPIDRHLTAQLLGFDGLQTNSYGAIAAVDYLTEACSVLAVSMLSLGRFVQDMLLWSTAEFNFLRLSDAYVQISSIMPQKRNPVPLEHVRALASRAMTEAQSVLGSLHNTPFQDMNDGEDDLQPLVYTAFDNASRATRLLAGVFDEAEFNVGAMAAAADRNFLPVTELADTLVRVTGMTFHDAHGIVSRAVKELAPSGYDPEEMTDIVLRELSSTTNGVVSRATVRASLSAENFVAVRQVPGGPGPAALASELARAGEQLAADGQWLRDTSRRLDEAHTQLHRQAEALVAARYA